MKTRETKPVNPELRDRLAAYRADGRSNSILARELGVSSAAVSTYISDCYVGDLDKIEERAAVILRTAPIRKLVACEIFETGITAAIASAIRVILETNDFAILHGPAGIGKTCGAAAYVADNPTAIMLTLWQDCCNAHYVQKEIFAQIGTRSFRKSGLNRTEFIFDALRGSNRLLVIDNANRATAAARKWLFDFHDATRCPVLLLGNPDIVEKIKRDEANSDQQESRVGLCPSTGLVLDTAEIPSVVARMLDQLCPAIADDVRPYAERIAAHKGHFRAVAKEVRIAAYLMSRGETDPVAAFRAAHTQLMRDYRLQQ